jgi:hypothetical protein
MNWLRNCFRRSSPVKRRPTRRRTRPLDFEQLEQRQVLSTVTYHGGPLISNLAAETVYFGPDWMSLAGQQNIQQVDTFVKTLSDSPYLDMLASYSKGSYQIGRGRLLGHDVTTDNWSTTTWTNPATGFTFSNVVTETQIQTMLSNEMTNGGIPKPDNNHLYVVYLPPSVNSLLDLQNNFAGHHWSYTSPYGTAYYAVIVDQSTSGLPLGAVSLTRFQQQTWVSSHEIAEAITDPVVSMDSAGVVHGTGWHTGTYGTYLGNEIGDIPASTLPAGQVDANLYGYDVQKEWIEAAGASLAPSPGMPAWYAVYQPVSFRSITRAHNQNGLEQEFALGSDGAVWTRSQQKLLYFGSLITSWGGWSSLGKPTPGKASSLQVGHNIDGSLEVFVLAPNYPGIGATTMAWTCTQTAPSATTFGGWQGFAGPTGSLISLTVADNANGLQEIFALGANQAVYNAHQYLVWNGFTQPLGVAWNAFTPLLSYVQSISVALDANNHLNLFALGFNDVVYTRCETSYGSWTGWANMSGNWQFLSITAARNADGSLALFGLGLNNRIYTTSQLGPFGQGGWGPNWTDLGVTVQSFTVGQNQDGRLQVFAVGFDSHVYTVAQTAPKMSTGSVAGSAMGVEPGEWGLWYGLRGSAVSLNVCSAADGSLVVFAIDTAGNITTATQDGPNLGWN